MIGEKIEELISKSGISKAFVAKSLNITPKTLTNKLSGRTEFTVSEIRVIVFLLNLSKVETAELILQYM